jgi:hypothetical protein
MSGGLLPASAGVILVLNSSFCMGTFWIVTPGCEASNDLMALLNTESNCPVLALFHQVSVTLELELDCALELLVALLEPPPLLQAASARLVAAAATTAAIARLLIIECSSPRGVSDSGATGPARGARPCPDQSRLC